MRINFVNIDPDTYIWVVGNKGWFYNKDGQKIVFCPSNWFINWLETEQLERKYFPEIEIITKSADDPTYMISVKAGEGAFLTNILEEGEVALDTFPVPTLRGIN